METDRKKKRVFTPEQKADIVNQIEADIKKGLLIKEAIQKHQIQHSQYNKWKRQLTVGIRSSLRNGKPPLDKEKKSLEKRIAKLESIIVEQAATIASFKKEMN